MRVRNFLAVAFGVAAIGGLPQGPAQAGDQYQSAIVNDYVAQGDLPDSAFSLLKPGNKVVLKPSSKPGDAGLTIQLIMKNVDCPAVGNDGGKAGKCGAKGSPVMNHVLDFSVNALGSDLDSVAGIKYQIEKGVVVFDNGKKNSIPGNIFGPLTSAVFATPLSPGILKFREAPSDPSACDTVPLFPGHPCFEGKQYAITGIVVNCDPNTQCTANTGCAKTQICQLNNQCSPALKLCTPEPCTTDAQCDQDGTGNGGTGQCGGTTCCDPTTSTTCADAVP